MIKLNRAEFEKLVEEEWQYVSGFLSERGAHDMMYSIDRKIEIASTLMKINRSSQEYKDISLEIKGEFIINMRRTIDKAISYAEQNGIPKNIRYEPYTENELMDQLYPKFELRIQKAQGL